MHYLKIKNWKLKIYLFACLFLLFLLPSQAHAGSILSRPPSNNLGLVGYWTFDGKDISGATAYDRSGQGNNGTISGATKTIGKIGQALAFNGTTNYINIGDKSSLYTSSGSVCSWVKTSSDTPQTILGFDVSATNGFSIVIGDGVTGSLTNEIVTIAVGNIINRIGYTTTNRSELIDNQWHYVCAISNGSSYAIYIDGVSKTISGVVNDGKWTNSLVYNGIRIGTSAYWNTQNFNGSIDDVRVYNRALSAAEVAKLYRAGSVKLNTIKPVDENLPANAVIGLVRQNCAGYSNCATSLSAWQTMMLQPSGGPINWGGCTVGDLTCVNKSAIAKIDGPWTNPDTTAVTINGWTTGANNYIKIYTTPQARHNGTYQTNKYRLEADSVNILSILEDYVRVDGLQFKVGATTVNSAGIAVASQAAVNNAIYISNNILRGGSGTSFQKSGIFQSSSNIISYIWNNTIYDMAPASLSYGIYLYYGASSYAYNNTLVNNFSGFRANGTATIKNNIIKGSGNSWSFYGTYTASSTNNSTDSTQTPSGSTGTNYTGKTFSFVSELAKDYHLLSTDTGAKDLGVNTSSESAPLNFTTDIDRQVRAGQWDIGADEALYTTVNKSPTNRLTSGLVGYWTFDGKDISGTTAYDKSGQGNNGTISGATKTIGKIGQALNFDGVDDWVITANIADNPTNMTVGGWFKFTQLPASGGKDLVAKISSDSSGVGWELRTWSSPNGYIAFATIDGNGSNYYQYRTNTTWNDGKWHHIIATLSGGVMGTINIYVDGISQPLTSVSNGTVTNVSNALNVTIGSDSNKTSSWLFNGSIDDVRIYNRALSAEEVKQLYNMGR